MKAEMYLFAGSVDSYLSKPEKDVFISDRVEIFIRRQCPHSPR